MKKAAGQPAAFFCLETKRPRPRTSEGVADADSGIAAVLGLSHDGFLLLQAPGIDAPLARRMLDVVAGRRIKGITGAADQVAVLRDA